MLKDKFKGYAPVAGVVAVFAAGIGSFVRTQAEIEHNVRDDARLAAEVIELKRTVDLLVSAQVNNRTKAQAAYDGMRANSQRIDRYIDRE